MISILAVLKAGAAYLPIDPALPAARMEFMLGDTAPIAVVTTAGLRSRLDGQDPVVIDVDDVAVDDQPSTALADPGADDIAYIIYTSGTTGVPKGVAISHHNVAQLSDSMDAGLELPEGQVWSHCHSLAFDFSVGRSGVRCCTVGAWWWYPRRWRTRRRTCTPCWWLNMSAC